MHQGGDPEGRRQASARALSPRGNDNTEERLLGVLSRYLSATTARAAMARAEQLQGSAGRPRKPGEMAAFFTAVERCAFVFLDRKHQSLLHGELQFELGRIMSELGTRDAPSSGPGSIQAIEVHGEWDISVVRARARDAVTQLGGKSWDVVKVMTLVSELARNVVLYTSGGYVQLLSRTDPRGLTVRVVDQGPGIPNLEEVLSGKYRSKTGLGRGLLGAQRLCHRFEIETDANGTRIEADMRF